MATSEVITALPVLSAREIVEKMEKDKATPTSNSVASTTNEKTSTVTTEATSAKSEEEIKPARDTKPKIVEKTEYQNIITNQVVFTCEEDTKRSKDQDQLIFEIVNVALTHQDPKSTSDSGPKTDGEKGAKLPTVHSSGTSYVRIHSPAILNALRGVVDYYPGQTLSGDAVTIHEPYSVLVHYEKEISAFREKFKSGNLDESDECTNKHTYEHLGLLQDFVKEKVGDNVDQERDRYRLEKPMVTFNMLWLLLRPGSDVYFDENDDEDYTPYVVKRVDFSIIDSNATDYIVTLWNLGANSRYMGPREKTMTISQFDGEKEMSTMRLYPCEYYQQEEAEKSPAEKREWCIQRGKKFFHLQAKRCMWFDGYSYWYPRRHYSSHVMVDLSQAKLDPSGTFRDYEDEIKNDVENTNSGISNCSCARCEELYNRKGKRSRFAGYSKIYAGKIDALTEHQYFISSREILAFVFKIREWKMLDVAGFSTPSFNKRMIDDLVIDTGAKDLIKSLTKMYIRNSPSVESTTEPSRKDKKAKSEQWSADSVAGKGEGLIFLLHGKPGVGKTYTAECIAEHTARPLLTLTCADIGTEPDTIERTLLYWFKMAQNWGAILLIDEADIYMENREIQDLKRNNIVASFLRTMEYYRGILFLTTNRIGTFDEAFISRIHVLLHYRDFTDVERKAVWQVFFKKLDREREDNIRVLRSTKDYVFEHPEVLALKWNGREIRNAVQIAVALAEAEDEKDEDGRVLVKEEHVRSTVRMSSVFKDYLKSLYKKDEAQRAAMRMIRFDAFDKATGTE